MAGPQLVWAEAHKFPTVNVRIVKVIFVFMINLFAPTRVHHCQSSDPKLLCQYYGPD